MVINYHKMKLSKFLFSIYLWVIFLPLAAVITVLAAAITIVTCAFLNDRFWGFYPAKIWARLWCYLSFVRVKVSGREHIEKNKSYVFVANHQSAYDVFAIYGWLNVPFKWVMKQELAKIPFVGKACKSAGHIFISRGQSKASLSGIQLAEKKLVNGLSVVIFPEGSRTHNGEVGNFKRGAFQIAADLRLPIIPITIKGAYEVMPRNSYYISPKKIQLIIHPAVDVSEYADDQNALIQAVRKTIAGDL